MSDWLTKHGGDLIQIKLIDLLSLLARLDQVWVEGFRPDTVTQDRIFSCDLPRLRRYLPDEALDEIETMR